MNERSPEHWSKVEDKDGVVSRHKYCGRLRCNVRILVHEDDSGNLELDYAAVVVSISGGNRKVSFCSPKCASLWLMQKDQV